MWLIALLTIYVVGFIGFAIAMYTEAPKHKSTVGPAHFLVALIWPVWIIWYLFVLAKEKIKGS